MMHSELASWLTMSCLVLAPTGADSPTPAAVTMLDATQMTHGLDAAYIINITGRVLNVNLQLRTRLSPDVPVFIRQSSKIVRAQVPAAMNGKNMSLYHDHQNLASVSVITTTLANGTAVQGLVGNVIYGSSFYSIWPQAIGNGTEAFVATIAASLPDPVYMATKIKLPVSYMDVAVTQIGPDNRKRQRVRRMSAQQPLRKKRSGSPAASANMSEYVINVFYMVDYTVYARFTEILNQTGYPVSVADVLSEIRYYFCNVANLVDLRYESIIGRGWTVHTNLSGIYISTSPEEDFWTSAGSEAAKNSRATEANADLMLNDFKVWVQDQSDLPDFNHAALFTGMNLYRRVNQSERQEVIGLAYYGGMCSDSSVALIHFTGALTEGESHAHELAHSLSARHDGDANQCSSEDHFIMAAIMSASDDPVKLRNYFIFSNCTIDYIDKFLKNLQKTNANCLKESQTLTTAPAMAQMRQGQLPGQKYTVDQQCEQALGSSWKACKGRIRGLKICTSLYCYDTSQSNFVCQEASGGARGADGTTCGNHKWCLQGSCTQNASAPAGSDTCPIGENDVPDFRNTTCLSMPRRSCYDNSVRERCCFTCDSVRNSTDVGCEYGDRQDCTLNPLSWCRTESYRNACCSYCQSNRLNIPNCEWGDSISNCEKLLASQTCSSLTGMCCQTCNQSSSSKPEVGGLQMTHTSLPTGAGYHSTSQLAVTERSRLTAIPTSLSQESNFSTSTVFQMKSAKTTPNSVNQTGSSQVISGPLLPLANKKAQQINANTLNVTSQSLSTDTKTEMVVKFNRSGEYIGLPGDAKLYGLNVQVLAVANSLASIIPLIYTAPRNYQNYFVCLQ